MNNVLELKDVRKSYRQGQEHEVKVLDQVNLTLCQGETAALVAPSGSGKSTLLHIAGLLDHADSGEVMIGGVNAGELPSRKRTALRRQDIGFVYQFHHLLPEFSALENIVLPQLAAGVARRDAQSYAETLLAQVGLENRADHRPSELSGGEQQRVSFCRALANKPRLLLADEPTGNLDPETSELVFETLMTLVAQTGLAALIATHNSQLAAQLHHTFHLNKGILAG